MTLHDASHVTTGSAAQGHQRPGSLMAAGHAHALRTAERACCCSARPVVVAVIPRTAARDHPTELMLCAHHYRASRKALAASGATVFDWNGEPVMPATAALAGAC
jgi:hypothetical protein